jgi:GST-like protein
MTLLPLPELPPEKAAWLRPEAPLVLYTSATPNGWKASITLEELGLDCSVVPLTLDKLEQKEPWFLAINPNGRIPALHDRRFAGPDGGALAVFESGALLWHLAEQAGRLIGEGPAARAATHSWLMFQMGGLGPMMGQANVFYRYAPEKIPFAIERYQRESRRLLEVLDTRLGQSPYLAGPELTLADIANWSWAHTYAWSGVSVEGLAHLNRWMEELRQRPAFVAGRGVPERVRLPTEADAEAFVAKARNLLV